MILSLKTFDSELADSKLQILEQKTLTTEIGQIVYPREVLVAANINPDTGLATDYLNVFNEAIMLLDLIGDMPDMIDELLNWRYLSYTEHFERSSFEAKELAVEVYKSIDPHIRASFDEAAQNLGQKIENTIITLQSDICNNKDFSHYLDEICGQIHAEIMTIDGLVHGQSQINEQDEIDALFG